MTAISFFLLQLNIPILPNYSIWFLNSVSFINRNWYFNQCNVETETQTQKFQGFWNCGPSLKLTIETSENCEKYALG